MITYIPVNTTVSNSSEWLSATVEWCFANVGPFMKDWGHKRDTFGRVVEFWFRHTEDALAFKLRWVVK